MPIALITGITGQDGSYLAELLLEKGYKVYGVARRTSTPIMWRLEKILDQIEIVSGDLHDIGSIIRLIQEIQPDEIYNLAAQSFVSTSWNQPVLTAETTGMGVLRLLEAIKLTKPDTKFYQASSSEMFGKVLETPQTETTPFYPRSPYAVAKLYAYWIAVNYREAYGMFACNGILFNHESPIRGETFVTRKITRALARIKTGLQQSLHLGNIDSKRDWGHARDFVEAQWMILQQDSPDDYVIATGEQYSVRQFIEYAVEYLGIRINWEGSGLDEIGRVAENRDDFGPKTGDIIVRIDPRYFRPTEVETLLGDASKARKNLGWQPKISFSQLVEEMVTEDLAIAQRDAVVAKQGFKVFNHHE